ncbi:MAG TPA: BamA/TamA family outer membrane protein [Chitinophagales bacterium]|nr:BamA/TamA family outer membrane protein [Chitinophagales bacterium]
MPLLIFSCNPTRKLKDGEHFLVNNIVLDKDTKLDKKDMEVYIKQKPNRKIFGFIRFHLWLHNLVNEQRLAQKQLTQSKKLERRNEKRISKGKKPITGRRQLLGEWLLEIGEPPVVYDSLLSKKSASQIKLYLNSKGYFISHVKDSVHYRGNKRADVFYKIKAAAPYTINSLSYVIPDELVKYYVFADTVHSVIKRGSNYDVDVLQKERERITALLNNEGYYLFTKDYIQYKIDTSNTHNKVNITMNIRNYTEKYAASSDSLIQKPHPRFYINHVYINPDFVPKKFDTMQKDTMEVNGYYILHKDRLRYKRRVLLNAIFIRKGELYQADNTQDTYKRLSELKAFKSIDIHFEKISEDHLDCFIQLSPILKQSFTIEAQGKNTSGNLGAELGIVYQNRNVFRGAEVLELKLKGGVEAQPTSNINGDANTQNNIGDLSNPVKQFNSIEIGPEANLYIPRFLLPFRIKFSKQSNPKTIFTCSYMYQRRPDYTRYITNLSFAYTWKETAKKRHTISPLVINFVKVSLSPAFNVYLAEKVYDPYIRNSFSNHLSTSTRYSFVFNEQDIKKLANFPFLKINAESSGNLLRGFYNAANKIEPHTFEKDASGRYLLAGIPFSQYLRTDIDYRYYFNSNEINKVVFRIAAGIGLPLVNFPSLPYERCFFSGGSNGIRAWRSRTLGPGSYSDVEQTGYNQFGDGQLEGNAEYRFKLFKFLHGAVFIDAGNNWLRRPDPTRPNGDFKLNRFYKEIAIGTGIGVRGDFNFFILRFDIGVKVRDPQFDESNRWVIEHWFDQRWKRDYRSKHSGGYFNVFNIGIGYPF